MELITTQAPLRAKIESWRQQGLKVALVPTMGNLHQGHLSLVTAAQQYADRVVVSIFVNPLQFNDKTDLTNYPRTIDQDTQKLTQVDCDVLFIPDEKTMYPEGTEQQSTITVSTLGDRLCGRHRPHHFDAVATVVCKLFNLVTPHFAFFGEKDYQQLLIIKKLVSDFNFGIKIVPIVTYREASGLAMSSRNSYLTTQQLTQASALYQTLITIKSQLQQGAENFLQLCNHAETQLIEKGFQLDYLEICRAQDLMPAQEQDTDLRILIAARLGQARLIDNIACDLA